MTACAQLAAVTACVLRLQGALTLPERLDFRAVEELLRAGPVGAPPVAELAALADAVAKHDAELEALDAHAGCLQALEARMLRVENRLREVHDLADKASIRADAQLSRIMELEQRIGYRTETQEVSHAHPARNDRDPGR